jgi:DNA-binding transcriptional regulator YdaS (Cro superfamily)
MTPAEAVGKAAKVLGSQAALAAQLGVEPPTVNQWFNGKRPVPRARAIEIEQATNGGVSRRDLCPDFPWDSPKPKKNKAA